MHVDQVPPMVAKQALEWNLSELEAAYKIIAVLSSVLELAGLSEPPTPQQPD
jgi:hypothetical protein